MTMPHLMNCPHSDTGHCLDCVKAAWEKHDSEINSHTWSVKCGAAIIGLYGALEICIHLDMDPHKLLQIVEDNVERFRDAKRGRYVNPNLERESN